MDWEQLLTGAAGFGNSLLFGAPETIARKISGDSAIEQLINKNKKAYEWGKVAGDVASAAVPVGALGKVIKPGVKALKFADKAGDLAKGAETLRAAKILEPAADIGKVAQKSERAKQIESLIGDMRKEATIKSKHNSPTLTRHGLGLDGEPITIYHGTNADINKFDLEHVGARANTEGFGIYFSANKKNADVFGKNIKKLKLKKKDTDLLIDESSYIDEQSPYIQEKLKPIIDAIKNPTPQQIEDNIYGLLSSMKNKKSEQKMHDILLSAMRKDGTPGVKKTLEEIGKTNPTEAKYYENIIFGEKTGRMHGAHINNYLENYWGNKKKVSEHLASLGIPGKIMESTHDMYSVAPSANMVIWDKDFINSRML